MKYSLLLVIAIIANYYSTAQTVPSYVPTDSLLGWYPFNGNAVNEHGTGKNGVPMGALLTTDRFGNANSAYHFNGKSDHISIDTAFFNLSWSNFTLSYWMNSDSLDNPYNADNSQVSINTVPHNGFAVSYNYGHCNKHTLYANSTPGIHTWNILAGTESHATINSHVWNHFAIEKRNDTSYYFYLNGVLDSMYISHILPAGYFCKLVLGNIDSSVGNAGFWGKLDDYGLWNRSLAYCEIRKLYDSASFAYLTSQPSNTTVASGATAYFSVIDTGTGNTYQWQGNTGSGFANVYNVPPYSGVTTPTLTVTGVTALMNNYKYRCVVSGAYPCVDTSAYGTLLLSTLGLTKDAVTEGIKIYPNPGTGVFTINLSSNADEKVSFFVYNIVGEKMKEFTTATNSPVNVHFSAPAGVYFLRAVTVNSVLSAKLIMANP